MLDKQQELTAIECGTVSSAVLEEAIVEERAADVQVIQRITRFHTSPLPDAETLSAYARLIPDGANRVLSLIERQTSHRHERETADARLALRGHWMAYTLALALYRRGRLPRIEGPRLAGHRALHDDDRRCHHRADRGQTAALMN